MLGLDRWAGAKVYEWIFWLSMMDHSSSAQSLSWYDGRVWRGFRRRAWSRSFATEPGEPSSSVRPRRRFSSRRSTTSMTRPFTKRPQGAGHADRKRAARIRDPADRRGPATGGAAPTGAPATGGYARVSDPDPGRAGADGRRLARLSRLAHGR